MGASKGCVWLKDSGQSTIPFEFGPMVLFLLGPLFVLNRQYPIWDTVDETSDEEERKLAHNGNRCLTPTRHEAVEEVLGDREQQEGYEGEEMEVCIKDEKELSTSKDSCSKPTSSRRNLKSMCSSCFSPSYRKESSTMSPSDEKHVEKENIHAQAQSRHKIVESNMTKKNQDSSQDILKAQEKTEIPPTTKKSDNPPSTQKSDPPTTEKQAKLIFEKLKRLQTMLQRFKDFKQKHVLPEDTQAIVESAQRIFDAIAKKKRHTSEKKVLEEKLRDIDSWRQVCCPRPITDTNLSDKNEANLFLDAAFDQKLSEEYDRLLPERDPNGSGEEKELPPPETKSYDSKEKSPGAASMEGVKIATEDIEEEEGKKVVAVVYEGDELQQDQQEAAEIVVNVAANKGVDVKHHSGDHSQVKTAAAPPGEKIQNEGKRNTAAPATDREEEEAPVQPDGSEIPGVVDDGQIQPQLQAQEQQLQGQAAPQNDTSTPLPPAAAVDQQLPDGWKSAQDPSTNSTCMHRAGFGGGGGGDGGNDCCSYASTGKALFFDLCCLCVNMPNKEPITTTSGIRM
eukprot:jgi/Bigna1/134889/aug1.27_g9597